MRAKVRPTAHHGNHVLPRWLTLYTIVSRRHEKRSTVVTTNLGYKQWPSVFPSAACVGEIGRAHV